MNSFGLAQAFSSVHSAAVIGIMVIMSMYMVALIIVRLNFFRKISVNSQRLMEEAKRAMEKNDRSTLAGMKGQRNDDPPVRILLGVALGNSDLPTSELSEVLAVTRMRQTERLMKGLPVFGTMAAIAPFIGLLGTVIGIVESFNSLAQSGAAGPNVVAAGVATALWATATGLVVAIPAVVAYNVFRNKAKTIVVEMEVVSREILSMLRTESGVKHKAA